MTHFQPSDEIRALLDATLEGIIIFNGERRCIYANKIICDCLDFTVSEMIGRNAEAVLPPLTYDLIIDQMRTGIVIPKEAKIFRHSGDEIDVLVRSKEIDLNDEKVFLFSLVDISSFKAKAREMEAFLCTDILTGVSNRHKLERDIALQSPYACLVFNIEDFHEINLFFGVNAGDEILKQVSTWLSEHHTDVYRIGGDEFALLFYNTTMHHSVFRHLAESLIISTFSKQVFYIGEEAITLNLYSGGAIGGENTFADAVIALHRARAEKRGFVLYEERKDSKDLHIKNIGMSTTIRKALTDDRIICYYQPIADFNTGEVTKYEALVRAIDDDGAIVAPNDFLPAAKKTKIYPSITQEVVEKACTLFAERDEDFSINLSIDDIKDPFTVQEILRILAQTGTAKRVVFEILESEGIENYAEVISFITMVKSLGAKIAIDDFGTGYSNFEHVLRLDVDFIKIDGSLIREIADNPKHHIIVNTIVDFSKRIGAKTIAEFVGDEKTYNAVKELGVDYSQGYYTGKPMLLFYDSVRL